jgi:hypothetical protein
VWVAEIIEPTIFGTAQKIRSTVAIKVDHRRADIVSFDILIDE